MQMAMDFEEKAIICALLLRFRGKKTKKEHVGSSVTQPKTA
jgi:hypothetical protein